LQWSVAEQQGIESYIVERSNNGSEFTSIGTVTANNLQQYNYSFTDASPLKGKNYYRLKMMEPGRYSYSHVVTISGNGKAGLQVYPVPAKDVITVERNTSDITEATITDMQGKVLMRVRLTQSRQEIDIASLAKGMYVLKAGNETVTILK
jgi:hypothetical protein